VSIFISGARILSEAGCRLAGVVEGRGFLLPMCAFDAILVKVYNWGNYSNCTVMEAEMSTATVSAMELRNAIGDILNRIQYTNERVVIERKGEPIAVMVRVDELDRLERFEREREAELFRMAKMLALRDGLQPFGKLIEQHEALHSERLGASADV
jgi:prevent-host-death family protein